MMLTVAHVMTKAALLEHMAISESWPMIFLTLDTDERWLAGDRQGPSLGNAGECSRGSWVCPVGSFRGGMADVL